MSESELYQFGSMNDLNVGAYMMIKTFPCKITEKSLSKTGKHGSSKAHVVGKDIFTDKKYEEIFGASDKVQIPIIAKKNYIVQFTERDNNSNVVSIFVIQRDLPIEVNLSNEIDASIITKLNELLNDEEDGDCVISVIESMEKERVFQCAKTKNN